MPPLSHLTSWHPRNLIYILLIPWLLLQVNRTYTCSWHSMYQISCPFPIAYVVPKDQSRSEARVSTSCQGQFLRRGFVNSWVAPVHFVRPCHWSYYDHRMWSAALVKLRKATVSFVVCLCLSVRPSVWNNSARTWRIFMKFNMRVFSKICREDSCFIKIWQE